MLLAVYIADARLLTKCVILVFFLQDWFTASARAIAKSGQPVQWITPLGLPVVQPYHHRYAKQVRCLDDSSKYGYK